MPVPPHPSRPWPRVALTAALSMAALACGATAPALEPNGPQAAAPRPQAICWVDPADDRFKRCEAPQPDGTCGTYGPPCVSTDVWPAGGLPREDEGACLYRAEGSPYARCGALGIDGSCIAWGWDCHFHDLIEWFGTAEPCLFDPASKRYRTCDVLTSEGRCMNFADGCVPTR